jgi:translation initiation factor IF-2
MTKVRVHEVAKDLGLSSKDVLAALGQLNIEAKSHMSVLEDESVNALMELLTGSSQAPAEEELPEEEEVVVAPTVPVVTGKGKKGTDRKGKGGRTARKPGNMARPDFRPQIPVENKEKEVIVLEGSLSLKDLAQKMDMNPTMIIKKLITKGMMITINQEVDVETAEEIALEFGYAVDVQIPESMDTDMEKAVADSFARATSDEGDWTWVSRSPVVTVMGHVDHGKTSLLDTIRKTNVTATEAGGITQHIGAYQVVLNNKRIVFLDTPGHEAFTAMRARGAQATDIAILVVAADDGIMPQTIEAINHAKAAAVPIIVAINKIDRPNANPEKVKQQLTEYGLVVEEWGGDTVCVEVSAKERIGIDHLLEMILLVAEMQDLKAVPDRPAKGIIIEAELDKGMGPLATVLIKTGTLRIGDGIIAGVASGKVRIMIDDKGRRIKEAGPSTPVAVIGLSDVPQAGDMLYAVGDEKAARIIAEKLFDKQRDEQHAKSFKVTLDNLFAHIQEGSVKELNIIVKADVQGSVEAVRQSFDKLTNDKVRLNVIHGGVGSISESDVMLASASNAIITGFNVRPDSNSRRLAEMENIDIRTYRIIYDAINDVKAAMEGMLDPEIKEVILGRAEVRAIFKVPRAGTVAGSYMLDGKITKNARIRLLRNDIVIHTGKIESLRRFKDDVREVSAGFEFGISLERFNDIKEGDILEAFTLVEV